ncbi:MAG: hypothetical protein WCT32_03840 [Patescibacteria group bacterium]|jgi:hypothetical protein
MREILILVAAIPVLAVLIDFFLSHSLLGKRYRFFVAPGVILHELSHAIGCVATGAKITHISFFDKTGGSVEHQRPFLPLIGQVVISLAPLVGGVVAIYLISTNVGVSSVNLTGVTFSYPSIREIALSLLQGVSFSSRLDWLLMYAALSVAVTMNPSLQDLKNVAGTFVLSAAAVFALFRYTDFRPDLAVFIPDKLIVVVSTVDVLLVLSLILSVFVFALSRMIKPV